MSNCKAARRLAVSAALVVILPLSAPARDHGLQPPPRRGGAHPALAAQDLSDAQKARLAAALARLDRVCAPLQMARDPLVTALQAMLQQREESVQMQQRRLRAQRSAVVQRRAALAARGEASGHGSADDANERLADIDGALATFARARTRTRKEYESLIGALQGGATPAAGSAAARRSLTQALGSLASRISRRIGPGTYRRIRRSAETRALSCYNAHWEQIGLVSADGKRCRLQSLGSLRPQFFDSQCSYAPQQQ